MDNGGNLELAGLPGETMTLNARSAVAWISSAVAEEQQDNDGATESIIRGEEGSIADTVQANDTEWVSNQEATLHPINGAVAVRQWSIQSSVGDTFGPSCDVGGQQQWSPIDYFFMMFPMTQEIALLTNEGLSNNNKAPATVGKILKFFGIMILCTKFEFRSRSSLWSTTSVSKYIPAPSFGKTGMS